MNGSVSPPGTFVLRRGLERLRDSAMLKQSLLVFTAGMVLNVCGFVAHAVASRQLGVTVYGGLYALINAALIAALPAAFVAPVVAQLAAEFRALHDEGHLARLDRQRGRRVYATRSSLHGGCRICGDSVRALLARSGLVGADSSVCWPASRSSSARCAPSRKARKTSSDTRSQTRSKAIAKVCGIGVLIAVGLKLGGGIIGFFLGPLSAAIYLGIRLRQRYAGVEPHHVRYDWSRIVNAGAGAAAASISLALMGSADVVLVKHFFDPHAAGLYAAASLGGKMLLYLVGFIPTVLLPQAADRHARGVTDARRSHRKLDDVQRRSALRALRLSVLRDRRAPRARWARIRCGRAAAGDLRQRDGASAH